MILIRIIFYNILEIFNKNGIKEKKAPEINISYQIEHEIFEENTEDENILNLISFIGFDNIEKQKKKSSKENK